MSSSPDAQNRPPALVGWLVAVDAALAIFIAAPAVWLFLRMAADGWHPLRLVPVLAFLYGLAFAGAAWGLLVRRKSARRAQVALGALLFPFGLVWFAMPGPWPWVQVALQYALGVFLMWAGASVRVTQWVAGAATPTLPNP